MLKVTIPKTEKWDDKTERFIETSKSYELTLEHSLVSISKWEQKWHKPYLSEEPKTYEETCDYIRCMTITQNIPPIVYEVIPNSVIQQVNDYIADPATATWFNHNAKGSGGRRRNEVVTSEIVYWWMIDYNIPTEFQKWHFNRLMTLIQVIQIKHEERDPNKRNKMSRRDILEQNRKLNEARRKALNTKG